MGKSITDTYDLLQQQLSGKSIPDTLKGLAEAFPGSVTFATSFSYEDQVVTDMIAKADVGISLFTLDTGRLFPETYSTWSRTNEQYGLKIKAYYPQANLLEPFIEENGPNSFYSSVEKRKEYCHIRKMEPFQRA